MKTVTTRGGSRECMTISKSFLTFVFDIYSTWKIWRFTKDCLQNKWKCTFTKCVPVLLESLLFCHCVFLLFLQRTLVWLFLLKFEWLLLKEKTLSMQRFVFADLFFFRNEFGKLKRQVFWIVTSNRSMKRKVRCKRKIVTFLFWWSRKSANKQEQDLSVSTKSFATNLLFFTNEIRISWCCVKNLRKSRFFDKI